MERLFELGSIYITQNVNDQLTRSEINDLITRHLALDKGDLSQDDAYLNQEALQNGERIFSCFKVNGNRYYVITEWDRSATTVLTPDEY